MIAQALLVLDIKFTFTFCLSVEVALGYEYKKRIRTAEQRALKKKKNSQVAKPRQKLSIFLLLSALPVLNYLSVYIALIFTLGQFSSYQFDCQLVFFFILSSLVGCQTSIIVVWFYIGCFYFFG